MGSTTTRSFTIGQLLALAVILQGMTIVTAGGSGDWSDKERATLAEEVLNSINTLRAKLNTKPVLQLDPDKTHRGLNHMALMYARVTWYKGMARLSVPLDDNIALVVNEKSSKTQAEMEGLLKTGILYYDSDAKHISGSMLVKLADKTEKATMSAGTRNFALKDDSLIEDPANCNTLMKLLWTRTKKIGVSAHWNADDKKQAYVILFEHDTDTPGKLTIEAVRFLDSLKCPKGPVKPLSDNTIVTVIEKAINDFRDQAELNLGPLKWTDRSGLMDLANVYAYDWAEKGKEFKVAEEFKKYPHIFFTDADIYNQRRQDLEKLTIARQSQDLAKSVERNDNGKYAHLASKLLDKLIKADREKVPMPAADSEALAQTSTLPRISQLLCKEATEFGYFATSYEFKTAMDVAANPIGFNFYVLLFDKKCDKLPGLSPKIKKVFRETLKLNVDDYKV